MPAMNARLQTAEHVLFRILIDRYGAKPRGVRYEKDRCSLDVITERDLREIDPKEFEDAANEIISKDLEVKKYFLSRKEAEKIVDITLVPENINKIMVVEIVGFDKEACAGNHVDNTKEIGRMRIMNVERKGKDIYRIYFTLEEGEKDMEIVESKKTEISPPKGTRDFMPEEMIIRQGVLDKVRTVFETFGFQPLETPAIENWEILSAKGAGGPEILKETYEFKDKGGRMVGLRYDLTVPLSRVVAARRDLTLPFKRYQIEKVWRYGDVTKDRFREFLQADIDTVGSESMLADAEIVACTISILTTLGFKKFVVRLNNRKILTALVKYAGVKKEKIMDAFRSIDKLDKIGLEGVKKDLLERNISKNAAEKILKFIKIGGKPETVLEKAGNFVKDIKEGREGIEELKELISYLREIAVEPKFKVDLSLARGLDYYTGPIFEVFAAEGIGSLAGGGRYDKMIGLFLGEYIPATGISLGIERIIQVMKERGMIKEKRTKVGVFVVNVNDNVIGESLKIAQTLRGNGIVSDFNLRGRSLTKQLEYVDSLGIPFVVIVGPEELKKGKFKLKDMETGREDELSIEEIAQKLLE